MTRPVVICIDDQREVLAALLKDLAPLEDLFELIDCESADEAGQLLDELDAAGRFIALVIADHVMPGQSGIDFLASIARDERFCHMRKLLLTGLASHADTIRAINIAEIDRYIPKPWQPGELMNTVRYLITEFIFEVLPDDYLQYSNVLDDTLVLQEMRRRGN